MSDEPFVLVFVILPDPPLVFNDSPKYHEKHYQQTIAYQVFGPGDTFGTDENFVSLC